DGDEQMRCCSQITNRYPFRRDAQGIRQARIVGLASGVQGMEAQALPEARPRGVVEVQPQPRLDALLQKLHVSLQAYGFASQRENAAVPVQRARLVGLIEGRNELAQCQVAGASEEHDVKGGGSGHERILLNDAATVASVADIAYVCN